MESLETLCSRSLPNSFQILLEVSMIGKFLAAMAMLGGVAMAQSADPTFNKDVLPILQKNCQTCHRPGQIAPMSFLTYESTRPYAKAMKAATAARKMPPWFASSNYVHIKNDPTLKQSDIDTIAKWVDAGAPEGDLKDAPPAIHWPENGWHIKPDMIIDGPEFNVPAKGIVEWTNVTVPGFAKDTWITSIELLPGNRSVTHHICVSFKPHTADTVYNKPTWADKVRDESGNELPTARRQSTQAAGNGGGGGANQTIQFCYVPGTEFEDYRPFGAGKFVPAGTDIVFGLHYTPNGKEVLDRPHLGFTVTNTPPENQYVNFIVNAPQDPKVFAIPPNDPNWRAPLSESVFQEDVDVVWVMAHMHVRGKDMTWELTYPDGRKQILAAVENFDFNWQQGYQLTPIRVPKGTQLTVTAHYNNSAGNRTNPDPNRTVYWGDQSWEEMMSPFFAVIVPKNVDPKKIIKMKSAGVLAGGA